MKKKQGSETSTGEKKVTSEKPVSLYGVDFKKILAAFLEIKPEDEKKEEVKGSSEKKTRAVNG